MIKIFKHPNKLIILENNIANVQPCEKIIENKNIYNIE